MKYTALSGTPLPSLWGPGLRHRRRTRRKQVLVAVAVVAAVFLTGTAFVFSFISVHDAQDAPVLSVSSAPVMDDAEALLSMYPLHTASVPQQTDLDASDCVRRYTLMLVSDADESSYNASANDWRSALRRGALCRRRGGGFSVSWLDELPLSSRLSFNRRGMELSTLSWFGGKLLACDDRTGVLYQVFGGRVVPRHILAEDKGRITGNGYKCEWATVRHGSLYVGGIGREWRSPKGEVLASNQNVMVLEPGGLVRSVNWTSIYKSLGAAAGIGPHGYLTLEAVIWSDAIDSWVMLPRRVSQDAFDDAADERKGGNLMFLHSGRESAPAKLVRIQGKLQPTRGFSAVRLLPGSADELVAIRTEEVVGRTASYLTVIRTNGSVIMEDTLISTAKFEGLEIAV